MQEKRTERFRVPKQIGVTETMASEIRLRAAHNNRPIELEIFHLISVGLQHDHEAGNENRRVSLHDAAHAHTSAAEGQSDLFRPAPPHTAPHAAAPRSTKRGVA